MPLDRPTSVRLETGTEKKLRRIADTENRTLLAQIRHILEQYVAWWEKQKR